MGTPDNRLSELVDLAKSWIPRRAELVKLPRDFWMPDHSCRVCYECDSQFNVFNRKHHCRLCGRVFCARCTSNSVPALSDEQKSGREDWEIIRVCNFCLKQWEQGSINADNGGDDPVPALSPSLSAVSLVSSRSGSTCNSGSGSSSVGSILHSTGTYQHFPYRNDLSPHGSTAQIESNAFEQHNLTSEKGRPQRDSRDQTSNQSDDEDDEYGLYPSDSESRHYGCIDDMEQFYGPFQIHHVDHTESNNATSSPLHETYDVHVTSDTKEEGAKVDAEPGFGGTSLEHDSDGANAEPVDFENNGLLWLPPDPEDEEDEKEAVLFDDDGDGATGEWGYLDASNSFGRGEFRNKEKSGEDLRKAMKHEVEGHFRALISQLLQVQNLPVDGEDGKECWLEIISSLCWEAATLLKPDMSKGGGMDPGGYVKVKCIACGWRGDSEVVKGVVCKKNVAHRRMPSRIDRPRFLILGGALEYQRVTNHLSSFDTLLQQEMDHLKMAVAKIDAHHPHVLLVEKSVSRHAQEYLLAKDISLVLNIKRPLLERIARCTGAQIVPSIDHLTSPKLGYCQSFHVDKFIEVHGSAGQGGKKLAKTLMFFEGCPKPFGCTILLKGANGDELKKVKHVVQYGVFAAYHLALETSFLADEGASLPELPLKSPLTVALPDKPSIAKRSISTIPGFVVTPPAQPLHVQPLVDIHNHDKGLMDRGSKPVDNLAIDVERQKSTALSEVFCCHNAYEDSTTTEHHIPQFQVSEGNKADDKSALDKVGPALANAMGGLPLIAAKDGEDRQGELDLSKEEFPPSPSDNNQSILVSLSTRCVWKGTVCERSHLFRIKYYGSFDRPLGRYLRDHLFDENYRCHSCDMPSEAHIHCYTHRQGSLTISVRKLSEHLPGEAEGKIWMWHRCLKCPRKDGFPLATRRIVMSDAAWGLSFGKFLELSFSNHAAASRVASCGHSLHRDCLRFYGFGRMVACFRYASIHVHSVYLPPLKVDFNFGNMDWLQNEANELRNRAELLFTDVHNALERLLEKSVGSPSEDGSHKASQARSHMEELERMLLKQKEEFMESLHRTLYRDSEAGTPLIDILEINKLRRQLLYYSYNWDQSLICVLKPNSKNPPDSSTAPILKPVEKIINSAEKPVEVRLPSGDVRNSGYGSCDSFLMSRSPEKGSADNESSRMTESDPMPLGKMVHRVSSAGEFPIHLNDGDTYEGDGNLPTASLSSAGSSVVGRGDVETSTAELGGKGIFFLDSSIDASAVQFEKLGISEYNPVYIRSVWELERKAGARLLLPVGLNNTIVPVYDDEPTSIVSHALISSDYRAQLSDPEKAKDGLHSSVSLSLLDPVNILSLNSLSESAWDSLKSIGSYDESAMGPSSSVSSTRDLHVRVAFTDDGPQGKTKYTVTCYYAEQFEVLRSICCPLELDYIRSLSRCKKWGAQGGKSNVFFAKTWDDRFVIKQVTKTELESFIKFGPAYFKYLSESINTKSPTCLAKILGIYQVSTKHVKSGKESKIDVLVMENLLFRRNITRLYDLKGSARARYNPDTSGSNKVLLDQNLIEAMPTSPIFVGNKAKRLLERAVWNDTSFLASIDVMDYSLLVGVDEERDELVLGIIDFMRQYTWDKHLETWVKTSGILGGAKNASPTVISPQMYKKRFRKAMSTYFLMVPDQWSPPLIIPCINSKSNGDDAAQAWTNNNTSMCVS